MAANKTIEDLIKSGAVKYGNDPSLVIHRLPVGIEAFDDLLGGGIPIGKIVELYGEESTGKTLVAQYMCAAIQKTIRPQVLYMDMEDSYDQVWWNQSNVDTDKLLVSNPATAEQAIDIMVAMLEGSKELGMIIIDSIAGMVPAPEADPEKSAEDKTMGLQARVIALMFRKIKNKLGDTTLLLTNQMRDSLGMHNEIGALPGGRANRHYCHIILKTRRSDWINEDKAHIGFYMEITSRKNKVANVADGTSITLPFMFSSQIDMLTYYLEDGIKQKLIERRGPYYSYAEQNVLGLANLRQLFVDYPEHLENLKVSLAVGDNG